MSQFFGINFRAFQSQNADSKKPQVIHNFQPPSPSSHHLPRRVCWTARSHQQLLADDIDMNHMVAFSHWVPTAFKVQSGCGLRHSSFFSTHKCSNRAADVNALRHSHSPLYPYDLHCPRFPTHSSSQLPTPTPSSSQLPSSTVTYVDPTTGSTVHIIGCVHGSFVSADDVQRVMKITDPDLVVLELCEARFSTLRKSILQTAPDKRISLHLAGGVNGKRKRRSFKQISKTFRGAPQAVLALLLDGAYRLQVLSGLDPGQEFANPIRTYPTSKIICGDDPASQTVNRLYSVFVSPVMSLRVSVEAFVGMFRRVLLPPKGGINLIRILFEPSRLQEVVRLLFAASTVGIVLLAFGSATAVAIDATPFVVPQTFNSALSTVDVTVQSIISGYLFVSILHFLKVLIIDRDVVIADNINLAMMKSEHEKQQAVTICAVVGLLHVNGILQELNDRSSDKPNL